VKTQSFVRFAASLIALTASVYACASKDTGADVGNELPPGGGTGGRRAGTAGSSGGSGGAESTGGSSSAGTGQGLGGTIMIGVDAQSDVKEELTEDAACGTGKAEATLLPVNIMMMFDRSGSMDNSMDIEPGELTRWATATSALQAFFEAPGADGMGVALRFFPHDEPTAGCTAEACACDATACADVLVDMGTLTADPAPTDTHEEALVTAIVNSPPDSMMGGGTGSCDGERGNTPIFPALSGALTWATAYQAANANQKTVVVFVTDGEPAGGCTDDFDEIDQLAADALAGAGISTYVIGLADENGEGVNQDDMNGLAAAGGTEEAFFVNDGPMAATQLQATFDAIRGMELSCDFPMPEATEDGDEIDPELVNVTFSSGTGDPVTFTKVSDAAGCDQALSWYYDNETDPTEIHLCPAACDAVTNAQMASVEVLVGCKPMIEPPH
jgi:hypothetical protein